MIDAALILLKGFIMLYSISDMIQVGRENLFMSVFLTA